MGYEKMKNLTINNIRHDEGSIDIKFINEIECKNRIKLPINYINFITQHNGACLFARIFDYIDPNIGCNELNSNSSYDDGNY